MISRNESNKAVFIYCDTGGCPGRDRFPQGIKNLIRHGIVILVYSPLEQANRSCSKIPPSSYSFDDMPGKFDDWDYCNFDDVDVSDKYKEIETIIGRSNLRDIQHLDAAYKKGCRWFFTSDKGDISSNKEKLEELLTLKIVMSQYPEELERAFETILQKAGSEEAITN